EQGAVLGSDGQRVALLADGGAGEEDPGDHLVVDGGHVHEATGGDGDTGGDEVGVGAVGGVDLQGELAAGDEEAIEKAAGPHRAARGDGPVADAVDPGREGE